MIRFVNKRMILVINRMCWREAGGLKPMGKNNLRNGCSLGFVDNICTNEVFGEQRYPTLHHQAAAYLYYISNRHIFHDGNKRTGLAVALTFLTLNGFLSGHLPEEDSYQFVVEIASSQDHSTMVINRTAAWLETLT
jgi:death-on-curing family protein